MRTKYKQTRLTVPATVMMSEIENLSDEDVKIICHRRGDEAAYHLMRLAIELRDANRESANGKVGV